MGYGHVKEHCRTPGTFMRRVGSVWVCDCGKVFRLVWEGGWGDSWKVWKDDGRYLAPENALGVGDE